jgi:hypothetical protein
MKQRLFALTLLAGLASGSLLAQYSPADAKIPFDFALGKTFMPKGEYRITQSSNGVLTIRELGGKHSAMTLTTPARAAAPADFQKSGKGLLVFQRYGDEYFLSKIWSPYARDGLALPQGPRYKELASKASRPEATTIALGR